MSSKKYLKAAKEPQKYPHSTSSSRDQPHYPSSTTATIGTPESQSTDTYTYYARDAGERMSQEKLLAGVGAWADVSASESGDGSDGSVGK